MVLSTSLKQGTGQCLDKKRNSLVGNLTTQPHHDSNVLSAPRAPLLSLFVPVVTLPYFHYRKAYFDSFRLV